MKIAIAVTSPKECTDIDTRGARAPYYLIVNTETGLSETVFNPASNTERQTGLRAAALCLTRV